MDINIDPEQMDKVNAALADLSRTIAEALGALSVPLEALAEAIREIFNKEINSDLEDIWAELKEAAAAEIPVREKLPRPPKKLGPIKYTAYCRKIRPTARSRC